MAATAPGALNPGEGFFLCPALFNLNFEWIPVGFLHFTLSFFLPTFCLKNFNLILPLCLLLKLYNSRPEKPSYRILSDELLILYWLLTDQPFPYQIQKQ